MLGVIKELGLFYAGTEPRVAVVYTEQMLFCQVTSQPCLFFTLRPDFTKLSRLTSNFDPPTSASSS